MLSLITAFCLCLTCVGPHKSHQLAKWTQRAPSARWTIACDPRVYPRFALLDIEGVGVRQCETTGSAIKGRRIDEYVESHKHGLELGRRWRRVRVLAVPCSARGRGNPEARTFLAWGGAKCE